jgi:hypothetical protein
MTESFRVDVDFLCAKLKIAEHDAEMILIAIEALFQ